ncbi:MAG: putative bifunctional diguanylate cyclase/phosphodiesterase [Noviherbaspirillum sp.]
MMEYPADELTGNAANPALANNQVAQKLVCVTRALKTLSAGNRTLLHASDEQELLHEMCAVIVEKGGYRLAVVAYAEHDENKSIRWMAGVGMDEGLLEALHFTWADTELGGTATGTAIRTGKPSVGRHLLTDPVYANPAYAPLREDAIKRGYASATAFPLRVEGEVLGAVVIAATEPDAFDGEEVKLLHELADDLAYGIANLRMRIKQRETEATIARLAYYDPLTGLPNRTLFLEKLEQAIQAARQQHHALALLHMDVGRFHEINNVLGYRSGDRLLQELGARLLQAIKDDETLARVGDAEFALLLPQGGAEYAIRVAQRLTATLHEPVNVSDLMVDPRVSIGIALFPGHGTEPDALLRRANAAAHQARPTRGGYAIYTGGQEQENTRRLALMGDLRRAIEHNELLLYCQPKVDIASRRICGAEALVRWPHPVHGMIPTIEFIKLAEQAGLITPLTNWMLDSAFSQGYTWHEAGLAQALSVNLSAHDLRDPRLIDRIQGLFSTWGIAPELIQFELTESALMEDPVGGLEALTRLKRLGSKLFIDDYGTGYSSLSYLQKLPVDSLKIDQSFVAPMVDSKDSAVIVRSTIEMGHNLDLEIVAEGVESQPVWDRLGELGCDVAQGYLMSMPMPAAQFQEWEARWEQGRHQAA